MAELWQAYGTWIIYAGIVLGMLWMHGGFGRRTAHHGARGHEQGDAGAHDHEQGHAHQDTQDPRAAALSSAAPAGQQDHKGHGHGRGCC